MSQPSSNPPEGTSGGNVSILELDYREAGGDGRYWWRHPTPCGDGHIMSIAKCRGDVFKMCLRNPLALDHRTAFRAVLENVDACTAQCVLNEWLKEYPLP